MVRAPPQPCHHIAIQEELNGKAVEWLERVTDQQYEAGAKAE